MNKEDKLKQTIEEYFYVKLKERYVDAEEKIGSEEIIKIESVKILPDEEFELLLSSKDSKINILFEAYCKFRKMRIIKVFEFDCRVKVEYDEDKDEYKVEDIGVYFPRKSVVDSLTFSRI